MKNSFKRVIIVNPFGIGDVLFSTPVIGNVKLSYPDGFIGYLCNIRTAPIFNDNPNVNKVFIYEKDDWRRLWKESKLKCIASFIKFLLEIKKYKFDLAIDLSLGRHYSFFLWLLGVKKRYGFNYKNRGLFLTHKIDIEGYQGKHVIEFYLDLLRFMGLKVVETRAKIYFKKELKDWAKELLRSKGAARKFLVGVVPGGGVSWGKSVDIRRWPKEKFAQLADAVSENFDVNILIFGDANEAVLCDSVISLMKHRPIRIVGETDLMQFATLLSECDLVIANDGGPLHLSVAAGVKTISLFGPVDERVYGQYPNDFRLHRIIKKDLPCRPCYNKFRMLPCRNDKECLSGIGVEDVLDAVLGLLKKD